MAVLVYANGDMVPMDDRGCDSPMFEHCGRKQVVTIGEVSGFIQDQLIERGLLELGVHNPNEVPNVNDILNKGLAPAAAPSGGDWAAELRAMFGRR